MHLDLSAENPSPPPPAPSEWREVATAFMWFLLVLGVIVGGLYLVSVFGLSSSAAGGCGGG